MKERARAIMLYQGRIEIKVLVIFPQVAEAIIARRAKLNLPTVAIEELEYGIDEVMEIVNRLDAKLLSGKKATIRGLLDILEQGWDIVWLITHAESDGWYLTDGIVNISETTTLIRSSGTFLTVMNTCSSYEVAKTAADELGTAFICTLEEVPDRQAFITGVIFAQKLAAGLDYEAAYHEARPGQNSTYRLIEARRPMPAQERGRVMSGSQMPDPDTINAFIKSVEDLDYIVNGSTRLGIAPLKEIVNGLQRDLAEIKSQLALMKQAQESRNWRDWAGGIIIICLLIAVLVLARQAGL